jgi:ADP-ribose pyrophosphatase YjhB (NUDIX family)
VSYNFQVRVTGVLLEEGSLLLVKQRLSDNRGWSLPGGRLEQGETLGQGVCREIEEETGLQVRVQKLLYVCDAEQSQHTLLHVTFLLERTGGALRLPDNSKDENPISDVRFVPVEDLEAYGFSGRFAKLAREGFPGRGYAGDKQAIGLGL